MQEVQKNEQGLPECFRRCECGGAVFLGGAGAKAWNFCPQCGGDHRQTSPALLVIQGGKTERRGARRRAFRAMMPALVRYHSKELT